MLDAIWAFLAYQSSLAIVGRMMNLNRRTLGKCLASCGLETPLRAMYYRIFGSKITKTVSLGAHVCSFHCPTPMVSDSVASTNKERSVIEWYLSQLHDGDTVWDIGANIGLWTLFAAKEVGTAGRVIAFEPLPAAIRVLRANLECNRIINVVIHPEALGSRNGVISLYPARAGVFSTSSFTKITGPFGTKSSAIDVNVRTGASIVEETPLYVPDALKLDVEGAEQMVLEGFSASIWEKLRVMVVEVHPDFLSSLQGSVEEVRRLISGHEFAVVGEFSRRNTLHWLCIKHEPGSRQGSQSVGRQSRS